MVTSTLLDADDELLDAIVLVDVALDELLGSTVLPPPQADSSKMHVSRYVAQNVLPVSRMAGPLYRVWPGVASGFDLWFKASNAGMV